MRQLVQDLRTGNAQVLEVPDPQISDNEVLVRNAYSVISAGTERALSETAHRSLLGKARQRPDQVRKVIEKATADGIAPTVAAVRARLQDLIMPGYSSAGVVEAVGPAVDGVAVGQGVGCVGANHACHAELVAVPSPLCVALPDGLELRSGAFGALGAVAAHGLRVGNVQAGARVGVIGLGLVGQLAAQLATAAGARAIAIDLSRERVDLALELGCVAGAVPLQEDVDEVVARVTGGVGVDTVIVAAAARDSRPLELAGAIARDRAVVSVIGDVPLEASRRPYYDKELQLRVSRSYGPGRYDPLYEVHGYDYPIGYVRWTERRLISYFFEELAEGRVQVDPLVSAEVRIEEAADAYTALLESSGIASVLKYRHESRPAVPRVTVHGRSRPHGSRLGIALVGPGTFARSTLLPELARADVELVAVVGRTPAKATGAARTWKARYVASDVQEVLSDESVDVLVIATRHDTHAGLATAALTAGKAVLVEKPLAIDQAELDGVTEALRHGGRLVVGFNRAFAPTTRTLIQHFRDRADPLNLHYRVNAGTLPADHWLRSLEIGGGRLVGEGCHFVDLCSTIVGRPVSTLRVDSLGSGTTTLLADSFVLLLRYDDGSIATIAYVGSGHRKMPKERLEVIGAQRAAVLDDFRAVSLFGGQRHKAIWPLPMPRRRRNKGHAALVDHALRFFQAGGEPPLPYDRLIETTRATLLARDLLEAKSANSVSLLGR